MDSHIFVFLLALLAVAVAKPTKEPYDPYKDAFANAAEIIERNREAGIGLAAMDYAKEAAHSEPEQEEPVMIAGSAGRTKRNGEVARDSTMDAVDDPVENVNDKVEEEEKEPNLLAGHALSGRTKRDEEVSVRSKEAAADAEDAVHKVEERTAEAIEKAKEATNEAAKTVSQTIHSAYSGIGTQGAFAMAAEPALSTAHGEHEETDDPAKAALTKANREADSASERAEAAYEGMQGSFAMAAEAMEKPERAMAIDAEAMEKTVRILTVLAQTRKIDSRIGSVGAQEPANSEPVKKQSVHDVGAAIGRGL